LKAFIRLVALGAMFIAFQPRGAAQTVAALHIHATTVEDLREWDAFVTSHERTGELQLRTVVSDPALPGRAVERFDQYHHGVRIWGADIVRDSERGVPRSIFGEIAPALTLSVEPSLNTETARSALLRLGAIDAALLTKPELVVLPLDNGDHRLAYTAVVSGGGTVFRAVVDALSGAELLRYSEIQTQSAVGTGKGVLGDTKKMSVLQQSGVFLTADQLRPPVLTTFDLRGNLARAKQVLNNGGALFPSDLASDTDNSWTDSAVVDAHAHVGWTYDFYFKRFGRRGLDNHDRPIVIVTNAVTQEGALGLSASDIDYATNAAWCGTCGPSGVGLMFFGNGFPAGFSLAGQRWTYLSGALDVAAHELTHAVTDSSSQLIYRNESGALNEAFSDMMGKSVEFFYHAAGGAPGQADYVIGKDVVRGVSAGALNGIRSMANPALYGDPDHYTKRSLGADDSGFVHTNSGIPNHVFYLAIEGGTNRTSGLSVQGVGPASRQQIENVFYRAFTVLMPANSTFATARAATIQAARDLYGTGSAPERAVTQAWTAAGVN